jgi:hypothetical protein
VVSEPNLAFWHGDFYSAQTITQQLYQLFKPKNSKGAIKPLYFEVLYYRKLRTLAYYINL